MPNKENRFAPKYVVFIALAAVVLVLDQASKLAVVRHIRYGREEIEIIPGFFSLIHAQNPGAAFGFLARSSPTLRLVVFGVFTVVAIGVLLSLLWQLHRHDRYNAAMLALIFGGAIGNAIDRIHKQQVTDFLKVYTDNPTLKNLLIEKFGTNEYPTFNIADAAIFVGVFMFLGYYLFVGDKEEEEAEDMDAVAREVVAEDSPGA